MEQKCCKKRNAHLASYSCWFSLLFTTRCCDSILHSSLSAAEFIKRKLFHCFLYYSPINWILSSCKKNNYNLILQSTSYESWHRKNYWLWELLPKLIAVLKPELHKKFWKGVLTVTHFKSCLWQVGKKQQKNTNTSQEILLCQSDKRIISGL